MTIMKGVKSICVLSYNYKHSIDYAHQDVGKNLTTHATRTVSVFSILSLSNIVYIESLNESVKKESNKATQQ
jgi:hypothetical protein